ncbi:MAG: SufD family Fe-S cluster assembly protein [Clostridia bacterium]|nr:SufD family Fe-S cluster assembly protein [Clostridia bacterium]
MNSITEKLLGMISNWNGKYEGAYNIRENGGCAGRQSTEHIKIENKEGAPGLEIRILPGTRGESVSIPACITHGDVDDLVYNDFYIGEDADVLIMAGCGVHTETGEAARHSGIHRFYLGKNSHVIYVEKHVGTGKGSGLRTIDPVTEVYLDEGAVLEMDTAQIGGVDKSTRNTRAELSSNAKLLIRERILTEYDQWARTDFEVTMNGEGAGTDLISRAVARGNSHQEYTSKMIGNGPCSGHSECDAIIADHGTVTAAPALTANHGDAALIHEAAIGKIAGEQILKLRTLGLTEKEAEAKIVEGFLG